MPKTPDEIKKGLECCVGKCAFHKPCPYENDSDCFKMLKKDALALIQQLEKDKNDLLEERELNDFLRDKVKQLEAERDAAINDMYEAQSIVCLICKNYYQPDPAVKKYGCKVFGEHFGEGSILCGMFEWRGVQKEE